MMPKLSARWGMIDAVLGRKTDALSEGRRAEFVPPSLWLI
jgi:hypothetical protein